jgi:hypothetical protein
MTGPDEANRRSRVHELGRMSRTQLIIIYQGLCVPEHPAAHLAAAGWDRDQLMTTIRDREDGQVPGFRPHDGRPAGPASPGA